MSINESTPILRHIAQTGLNYVVDRATDKLRSNFDAMQQDFSKMDYQAGCTGKVVTVVKWALLATGGGGTILAGVEWFYRSSVTLDPMTVLIGSAALAAIGCIGGCCLGKKASFEQSQGQKYYQKLKEIYIQGISEAAEKSAKMTKELIADHRSAVILTGEHVDKFDQSIVQAGDVVIQISKATQDLHEVNRQTKETLDQVQDQIENLKEEADDQPRILRECDAFIAKENAN